jgi:3-oxoacyl-[acyl-carrier protein] reductase
MGTALTEPRHVIVSGGSRGLGKAITEALLDAGYKVSAFSRTSSDFVQQMAGNDKFFFAQADLSDGPSISAFLKAADHLFGAPYGLVNCAAIAAAGLLATASEDSIRKVLSVNAEGTLCLTRRVVRRMLSARAGGVILNISSISSLRGFKGLSTYAFTKGGLDALTRALARELGPERIRVNSIAPGYYDTDISRSLTEEQKQQILRRTPLGRLGEPKDVVGAVRFLLSDEASFITGQVLVIDGGSTV